MVHKTGRKIYFGNRVVFEGQFYFRYGGREHSSPRVELRSITGYSTQGEVEQTWTLDSSNDRWPFELQQLAQLDPDKRRSLFFFNKSTSTGKIGSVHLDSWNRNMLKLILKYSSDQLPDTVQCLLLMLPTLQVMLLDFRLTITSKSRNRYREINTCLGEGSNGNTLDLGHIVNRWLEQPWIESGINDAGFSVTNDD